MVVLASLASQPRRESMLEVALRTLRPQVDVLSVYLNGYRAVPSCVLELADRHEFAADNEGAERKFWWADREPRGLHFSCDDDIVYPPDYVAVMKAELEAHAGALVTAHGRAYRGAPVSIHSIDPASLGLFHHEVKRGRAINCPGTGVMAWDAHRVALPAAWSGRNMADVQVAIWAQRNRVPIWLVPHAAGWLKSPALHDPRGLFAQSRHEGHASRTALIRSYGQEHGWRLWT